jgi:hypothetical protein
MGRLVGIFNPSVPPSPQKPATLAVRKTGDQEQLIFSILAVLVISVDQGRDQARKTALFLRQC